MKIRITATIEAEFPNVESASEGQDLLRTAQAQITDVLAMQVPNARVHVEAAELGAAPHVERGLL